jgi:hypothetical protein
VLSNPYHGGDLPPSWRTLYELTKLPNESGGLRRLGFEPSAKAIAEADM